MIARSGATVGKSYIHKAIKNKNLYFYAGYMIRFAVDVNKANPDYIFYYTQLGVYKDWTNAIQRAAGQPNINAEEYKSLKIPLPPLEKQNQIAERINQIRQQAAQLHAEANTELEQAKKQVEKIILGNV